MPKQKNTGDAAAGVAVRARQRPMPSMGEGRGKGRTQLVSCSKSVRGAGSMILRQTRRGRSKVGGIAAIAAALDFDRGGCGWHGGLRGTECDFRGRGGGSRRGRRRGRGHDLTP